MSDPAATQPTTPTQSPPNEAFTAMDMENDTKSEAFAIDHDSAYITQPQPASRRYSAPKADRDTFDSQQAFLDSLHPIEIEDVEEDEQKCPLCWKQFGEGPDPGHDNSERPVRLRCNHVYGDKCLADLFRLPETSRVKLHPLRFFPGDKGHLLGQILCKYRQSLGAEFRNRNDVELFEKFLTSIEIPSGPPKPEDYWNSILVGIFKMIDHRSIVDITFMENAVVLDQGEPLPDAIATPRHSFPTQDPTVSPSGLPRLNQRMVGAVSPHSLPFPKPPVGKPEFDTNFFTSGVLHDASDDTASPQPLMSAPGLSTPSKTIPRFDPQKEGWASPFQQVSTDSLKSPPQHANPVLSSETSIKTTSSNNKPLKPWMEALNTAETKFDKLSALRNEKLNEKTESMSMTEVQLAAQAIVQGVSTDQLALSNTSPGCLLARQNGVYLLLLYLQYREHMSRDRKTLLARKLVDVLEKYEASQGTVPISYMPQLQHSLVLSPYLLFFRVPIHIRDRASTSCELYPHIRRHMVERDGILSVCERSRIILLRSLCTDCELDEISQTALPTPTEVTWARHAASNPDSCPLCQEVLFRSIRTRSFSGIPPHPFTEDAATTQ
ncbi:hypothetical protein HBI38_001130 [Parastagonospora nodorum]|nr:hypothetical protein HBH74_013200 [Parastagonospora nodorum]KAH4996711.1 hypothetical protein HBH73_000390 [Parastagonospora nodorum]KAH5191532.1 hypothetical protein HBH76_077280 [Parastagonospora nodorum]KAH5673587.1 hypothetical protein HBI21_148890 [Parastagonospora nodorum]KAH6228403.1 hypothetical protein HBI15_082960 [Parastagonospora nodorum]